MQHTVSLIIAFFGIMSTFEHSHGKKHVLKCSSSKASFSGEISCFWYQYILCNALHNPDYPTTPFYHVIISDHLVEIFREALQQSMPGAIHTDYGTFLEVFLVKMRTPNLPPHCLVSVYYSFSTNGFIVFLPIHQQTPRRKITPYHSLTRWNFNN